MADYDLFKHSTQTDEIQVILDGLGTVKGIKQLLLVSDEGFPILSARTLSISEEVEAIVSAMVAGIVHISSGACNQLNLGDQIDFIHVQTPVGLGILTKIQNNILVLITDSNIKLGFMHYLVNSTRSKILDITRSEEAEIDETFS